MEEEAFRICFCRMVENLKLTPETAAELLQRILKILEDTTKS